jgi:cyclopropane-fatty-acyl-phospholipid synthase
LNPIPPKSLYSRLRSVWRRYRTGHSRQNVVHHYDLGNEFYRLWLDEQLLYTCAYFGRPGISLEEAQIAKMDHVCRKLRLRAGETVIEAGCGWGALALHMARQYGVRVRSYNLSREQLAFARARARREDLEKKVEFVEADWRDIRGTCDAFVSVGMLEHVGPENFRQLGKVIRRALGTSGRGLIHSIGQNTEEPLCPWIEQHIFPGAQPPTLQQMMDLFGPYNLSVLDLENLRPHYAQTLRHWLLRFDRHARTIGEMFGDRFVRMWRIYLASSAAAFEIGSLQLYQALFAPIGSPFLPLSRRDIYEAA